METDCFFLLCPCTLNPFISSSNLCSISDVIRNLLFVSNKILADVKVSRALLISSWILWYSSGWLIKDLIIFCKVAGVTSDSVRKLMVSRSFLPDTFEFASLKIRSALSYRFTSLTGGWGWPSLDICQPVTVWKVEMSLTPCLSMSYVVIIIPRAATFVEAYPFVPNRKFCNRSNWYL